MDPVSGTQRHFKIRGMDCAEEISALKREVGPLVGGEERLTFDLLRAKMTVAGAAPGAGDREIVAAVERAGMQAEVWQYGDRSADPSGFWQRRGRALLTAASGMLTLLGFCLHAGLAGGPGAALGREGLGGVPSPTALACLLAVLAGGWQVAPKAWLSLRRLRPDMNLLMTVAVLGALGIGDWLEAATVSFLFALSLTLESWSVGRARRAIAGLMDLAPQTARLLRANGSQEEVPAATVPVGARLLVRTGERIPLDGRVVAGESAVNQAPITGESVPVEKHRGSEVFAGTINGDGALEVESTKLAGETTLAHIVRLVEEAQSRRAPSEQWVERFARIYTPAVMAAALVVLLVPPLFTDAAWSTWLYRSLVLLVIACPCALVISTPVSIVAGLAAAAHRGVLIKGGLFLEAPARLRAVALDKTGTLTQGQPSVLEIVPLAGHEERELLERVAALESRSDHPLARAIVAYATRQQVASLPADRVRILQGKGATGSFDGEECWLGSHRYLEERGQETPDVHQRLAAMSNAGRTAVVVGTAEHVCGLIAIADTVRPEAKVAIAALRALGIEHVIMLTGDNRGTAEAVARETGVDEVRSELLPQDKVDAVDELVKRYGAVAMVGDGVNDAPAMARATLAVAMGAAGSDTAIETADVALMSDDLAQLPWLIGHARRTLAIVRQNIGFALAVKAVFVVLALLGQASLWAAIAADMGASLLVIANGLRLLQARSR